MTTICVVLYVVIMMVAPTSALGKACETTCENPFGPEGMAIHRVNSNDVGGGPSCEERCALFRFRERFLGWECGTCPSLMPTSAISGNPSSASSTPPSGTPTIATSGAPSRVVSGAPSADASTAPSTASSGVPTFTSSMPSSAPSCALSVDPSEPALYGIVHPRVGSELYRIDPDSGCSSLLGSITPSGLTMNGFVYCPTIEKYFIHTNSGSIDPDALYTLDVNTLVATRVGETNFTYAEDGCKDLACNSAGELVCISAFGRLNSVDTDTGFAIRIGSITGGDRVYGSHSISFETDELLHYVRGGNTHRLVNVSDGYSVTLLPSIDAIESVHGVFYPGTSLMYSPYRSGTTEGSQISIVDLAESSVVRNIPVDVFFWTLAFGP